jgi:hypothetical protein
MLDPLPNKMRTRDDPEIAILSLNKVKKSCPVQLLQVAEIQLRPQLALGGALNQLVQIRQMSLK